MQFTSITPYTQRLKNSYVYWSVSSRSRKIYVRTSHLSVLVKKKYVQIYILCNSFCLLSACSLRCKRNRLFKILSAVSQPKNNYKKACEFFFDWLLVHILWCCKDSPRNTLKWVYLLDHDINFLNDIRVIFILYWIWVFINKYH